MMKSRFKMPTRPQLVLAVIWVGFAALAIPSISHAYEVDQFTHRAEEPAHDSVQILNSKIRDEILGGIQDANRQLRRRGLKCVPGFEDTDRFLEEALAERLVGSDPVAIHLERWMTALPEHEYTIPTAPAESIYAGTKYGLVVLSGMIVPELEVGGLRIGTDKIGHFFQLGLALHRKRKQNRYVSCTDLVNETRELGFYGCGSGGFIYSYGDMTANFAGMHFWQRFSTAGAGGYASCSDQGRFVLNRKINPFNLADYVSPLWDEAVNCSVDCSTEDHFLPSTHVTVISKIGRYSCPWPDARFQWQGASTDAVTYCEQVRADHQAGRRIFPANFLGDTDCVREAVSPACLGFSNLQKNIKSLPKF